MIGVLAKSVDQARRATGNGRPDSRLRSCTAAADDDDAASAAAATSTERTTILKIRMKMTITTKVTR